MKKEKNSCRNSARNSGKISWGSGKRYTERYCGKSSKAIQKETLRRNSWQHLRYILGKSHGMVPGKPLKKNGTKLYRIPMKNFRRNQPEFRNPGTFSRKHNGNNCSNLAKYGQESEVTWKNKQEILWEILGGNPRSISQESNQFSRCILTSRILIPSWLNLLFE